MKDQNPAVRKAYGKLFLLWAARALIIYLILLILIAVWLFGIEGYRPEKNVQRNYAKFLVEQNDTFVTTMLDFQEMTADSGREYSYEQREAIGAILREQNDFLVYMQTHAPSEENEDYLDIYQDMLQIYGFYIQGEVMVAEYCYAYRDSYLPEDGHGAELEKYTMGSELCNMFGNMVLNNFRYINDVRETDYQSKYNIQPLE